MSKGGHWSLVYRVQDNVQVKGRPHHACVRDIHQGKELHIEGELPDIPDAMFAELGSKLAALAEDVDGEPVTREEQIRVHQLVADHCLGMIKALKSF